MPPKPRTWDARLARWMILPLVSSPVTPNHLTTIRLIVGLMCAGAFAGGGYLWGNLGALLLVVSNVVDHADGELARVSGKTSRLGHFYDLAADALVTVLLFVGIGANLVNDPLHADGAFSPYALAGGTLAGASVAAIFFLRMRIEELAGKAGTLQPSWGGFELEDILYLLPIVTLLGGLQPFLILSSIGAPAFAIWVGIDFVRVSRSAGRAALAASLPKSSGRL